MAGELEKLATTSEKEETVTHESDWQPHNGSKAPTEKSQKLEEIPNKSETRDGRFLFFFEQSQKCGRNPCGQGQRNSRREPHEKLWGAPKGVGAGGGVRERRTRAPKPKSTS